MMFKKTFNKQPMSLIKKHSIKGFTVIELMIIVALLSIIMTIAVPNFTQLINNNRSQALTQEVIALLGYARSVAVTKRTTTAVCPENDAWLVKEKDCDANTVLRRLDIPTGTSLSTQSDEFIFRYNGTSNLASIISCANDKPTTGYLIEIRNTGSARTYQRGQSSAGALSSCDS